MCACVCVEQRHPMTFGWHKLIRSLYDFIFILPPSLSRSRFPLRQGKGKGVFVESKEVLSWRESFYLFKSILHYFSRENRLSSPICAPLRIRGKKSHKNHRQHRSWLKCAATWLTYTHTGIDTCVCTQIRMCTCVCEDKTTLFTRWYPFKRALQSYHELRNACSIVFPFDTIDCHLILSCSQSNRLQL